MNRNLEVKFTLPQINKQGKQAFNDPLREIPDDYFAPLHKNIVLPNQIIAFNPFVKDANDGRITFNDAKITANDEVITANDAPITANDGRITLNDAPSASNGRVIDLMKAFIGLNEEFNGNIF